MRPRSPLRVCALFALLSYAQAASHLRFGALSRRDVNVCKDIDSGLPNDWKCGSDKVCISLDNSTSALCCPAGENCSSLQTIDCDVKKLDPTKNPNTEVFTTKTDASLPPCGTSCCPFGYTCSNQNGGPACVIEKDKARFIGSNPGDATGSLPSSTSTSSSATSATSTSKSTATTTSSAAQSTSSSGSASRTDSNPFPPGHFFIGFVPGLLIGVIATLCWFGYREKKKEKNGSTKSTPNLDKRPVISEPIDSGANQWRTDFTRKAQRISRSIFGGNDTDYNKEPNTWKMPTPPVPNQPPVRLDAPATPTPIPDRDRVPTMESIKIYSPPNFDSHPSAAVSPLRTNMTNHQNHDERFGSPFKSPIRADGVPRYDNPARSGRPVELEARPASSIYDAKSRPVSSLYHYDRDPQPQQPHADPNKRDTSFTALMQHCGVPDAGDPYPVPKIPDQYRANR